MSTDVLSDVLSAVRLTGSVFFDVTAATPWVAEAPPAAAVSRDVAPRAQRAIEYHVVAKGSCWASIVDRGNFEPVKLVEGDIIVFPHGDPHALSSTPGMRAEPTMAVYRRPADENALPFKLHSGTDGPADVHLICGFFSCDARPFNPLLDSLPPFMRLAQRAEQPSRSVHSFRQRRDRQQACRQPEHPQ